MLRWLISAVGLAVLKGEVAASIRRATRRAMLAAVATLLWIAAFGFAVAALAVWLSQQLGPIAACGIIAAGFAVIGIAIQAGLALSSKRATTNSGTPLDGLKSAAGGFRAPDLGGLGPIVVVGIVGFIAGRLLFRK